MIFANIRELKLETGKILELSRKNGPVMVTKRGQPVAIIRGIKKGSQSVFTYSEVLNNIRQAAEKSGYRLKDVNRLINEVRKNI
ncbi:MAG: type II toxin-antitoxin system prevent-host-death family antitoxin [Candidatus Omnitrophica bacterium]|nr:type II toxin-antitoxin system prevent-host-death family antitoxin [Candidatus Omnitrophota bacterium]